MSYHIDITNFICGFISVLILFLYLIVNNIRILRYNDRRALSHADNFFLWLVRATKGKDFAMEREEILLKSKPRKIWGVVSLVLVIFLTLCWFFIGYRYFIQAS